MVASTAAYEPRFDAGRVSLDLLATSHPEERLDGAEALGEWLRSADLLPAGTRLHRIGLDCVQRFRQLRQDMAQLVAGEPPLDGKPFAAALARVNEAAAAPPPAPRAVPAEDGRLVRVLHAEPDCAALLAAIARDFVELLTDPVAAARIRQCEGDNCPRIYLDTSRGRRRRWCSSEVCGNRERVARHRRRMAVT
ncbi:CGNR zinc finger domain-containing protein [Streptomyces sp. TRM66268-LWL]|uniref:CGNR zinc finger domain-containing protein n=1 Tax=Streptomyces polyasparticus TaxID=2767826 RepID=A0ABR7SRY9_9ACTN|nr:CGNR zinc finger domain-containing protein [Streptomyces polyasparticus]MBC9718204.1 CGNR zinc finger domain-containing protein [Streptomyces polyasparticus]